LGGRFTYNLNQSLAIEAATYFFPDRCSGCFGRGSLTEGLFGVKAGKRFQRLGVFGKIRPGVASFSRGQIITTILPGPFVLFSFRRQSNFAVDAGGVLEAYLSRRLMARWDVGDTIVATPFRTEHHFQVSAGIGFRF
jgi:hypothetical protein